MEGGGNQPRGGMGLGGFGQGQGQGAGLGQMPLLADSREQVDPRSLGFWGTMKSILCPQFQMVSFTFMICLLDAAVFVISLIYSKVQYGKLETLHQIFLCPDYGALSDLGAKVRDRMKGQHFEFYRWVMPMFLHAGLLHIMMNTFCQLILCTMMERIFTMYRTAVIYFVAGYGLVSNPS